MTMLGGALAIMLQTASAGPAVPIPAPPASDTAFARMVALYDEVCLQTFPIDDGVDRLMAANGATALTPEQVKVTLVNDPGRGWELKDGDHTLLIFLELPPFHACSVRQSFTVGIPALAAYRTVAARFEADHPGFGPGPSMERDLGKLHVHGVTRFRQLPSGGAEMLMVIDQHSIDARRVSQGETAVELRLAHQIHTGS